MAWLIFRWISVVRSELASSRAIAVHMSLYAMFFHVS